MRVAILCTARSGSTSLFYLINCLFIKNKQKYISLFEPFNFINLDREDKLKNIDSFKDNENVLIKTFIDANNYPYESFDNVDAYWDWFFKYFDKVIVLERKNKRLQAESLYYHIKLSKNRTVSPYWHKQKYYDLSEVDEEYIRKTTIHLEKEVTTLHSISEMGYPLFLYESIFVEKDMNEINRLLDYLNLPYSQLCIDEWINSPYKKVRLDKKENKLI